MSEGLQWTPCCLTGVSLLLGNKFQHLDSARGFRPKRTMYMKQVICMSKILSEFVNESTDLGAPGVVTSQTKISHRFCLQITKVNIIICTWTMCRSKRSYALTMPDARDISLSEYSMCSSEGIHSLHNPWSVNSYQSINKNSGGARYNYPKQTHQGHLYRVTAEKHLVSRTVTLSSFPRGPDLGHLKKTSVKEATDDQCRVFKAVS